MPGGPRCGYLVEIFLASALLFGLIICFVKSSPIAMSSSNSDEVGRQESIIIDDHTTSTTTPTIPSLTNQQDDQKQEQQQRNKREQLVESNDQQQLIDNKNGATRKALEQVLRQYFNHILGNIIAGRKLSLVESRVVSKREPLVGEKELANVPPSQSGPPPSSSSSPVALSSSILANKDDDSSTSLEDHQLLIERYARSPFDFINSIAANQQGSSSSLIKATPDKRDRFLMESPSNSDDTNERYIEAIINDMVIDQMLRQHQHNHHNHNHSNNRLQSPIGQQEIEANRSQENEFGSLNGIGNSGIGGIGGNGSGGGREVSSQIDQQTYTGDAPLLIQQTESSSSYGGDNNLSEKGLSQLLHKSQATSTSGGQTISFIPELATMDPLLLRNDQQAIFSSSMASPLQFDANFPKRQVRFHQCYFNPISCFRRRRRR